MTDNSSMTQTESDLRASPQFYSVAPRVKHARDALAITRDVISLSDEIDLDGMLLFTGSGAPLDPWVAGTAVVAESNRLRPIVAINPVTMHPFTAARMVSSLAQLYSRRVAVNLIAGTALSDHTAVGDQLDHAQRYARLAEFADVMLALLGSQRPLTFEGQFYQTLRLQLQPPIPPELSPEIFVSGESDSAVNTAARIGATRLQMLPPSLLVSGDRAGVPGLHFGVITRESDSQAWQAAHERFGDGKREARLVEVSMANTDATWKRRLFNMPSEAAAGYWVEPFETFQADCPYFVGDYKRVGRLIEDLVGSGVATFIFEIPADKEDFHHVNHVLQSFR